MLLMKYAVNHPWKFKDYDYAIAFLAGLLQATMALCVESVNYIALITNRTHLDLLLNFMALVVIADFDDFFFGALFDRTYKDVVTDIDVYSDFLII